MTVEEYLDFLHLAEALKSRTRHSVMADGRKESVAEHSWRLALMAILLREELPEIDSERLTELCLIHDLGEAVTGDIPTFQKTREHEETEKNEAEKLFSRLPPREREHFLGLYREFQAQETREAKLCKALDKCEALLQHNEAPLSSWLELEYELQMTYGREECECSPFTHALREALRRDSEEKIRQGE